MTLEVAEVCNGLRFMSALVVLTLAFAYVTQRTIVRRAVLTVMAVPVAIVANAVAGPISTKLQLRSGEEILTREMVIQGILSIQAGDNPRVTMDRMMAFIPSGARGKLAAA